MIILRPDQQDLKQRTYADWANGSKNVLNVLSTGGGKSIIMSDIILDVAKQNKQQVVMAHRNELVAQMSNHIADRGISHRIIGSSSTISLITRQHRSKFGRSFINPSSLTAVAGVDTIIACQEILKDWLHQTDHWFGDEAHHFLVENKWGKAVSLMSNALGLGVTATPLRADGKGLGRQYEGVFDTMQIGLEMRQLIKNGSLADFEIVCPKSDLTMAGEKTGKNGDWSHIAGRKASKRSHIVGDVVKSYRQYAFGKQAICFATDVETAHEISNNFNDSNIKAAALSAKTNYAVREKYIQEFRDGKLTILVNVDLFDEGFDVPMCEVVIMARPTASLGKYRQMIGRALRSASGKIYGLIIDHVSNVIRHGLPDKHIIWTLAQRDKRGKQSKDPDKIELTVCNHCAKPYEKFHTLCPYCELAPPLPEKQKRTIEMVSGDLILLDRVKLDQMRSATEIESADNVGDRVGIVAGKIAGLGAVKKQREKIKEHKRLSETIAQWAAIQRVAGYSDREIEKKFYLTTNIDVLSSLDGSRTRLEFETLANTIEAWYL